MMKRPAMLLVPTPPNSPKLLVDRLVITALGDTGASVCIMRDDVRCRLKKVITPCSCRVFRSANAEVIHPLGQCPSRVQIRESLYQVTFFVLASCSHPLILGWDFLSEAKALIDCSHRQLYLANTESDVSLVHDRNIRLCAAEDHILEPRTTRAVRTTSFKHVADSYGYVSPVIDLFVRKSIVIPHCLITSPSPNNFRWVTNVGTERYVISRVLALVISLFCMKVSSLSSIRRMIQIKKSLSTPPMPGDQEFLRMIDPDLTSWEKQELLELLRQFQPIFDPTIMTFDNTSAVVHRVNTGQSAPIKSRPNRVSSVERKTIQEHVSDMLTKGVVQESSSQWSSTVVLVGEKDCIWRFCVDYRRLNNVTRNMFILYHGPTTRWTLFKDQSTSRPLICAQDAGRLPLMRRATKRLLLSHRTVSMNL